MESTDVMVSEITRTTVELICAVGTVFVSVAYFAFGDTLIRWFAYKGVVYYTITRSNSDVIDAYRTS